MIKTLIPVLMLLFSCAAAPLRAQDEFDRILNFKEIQHMLDSAIQQKDLGLQALAWYHWARYEERKTGVRDSAVQYMLRSIDRFGRNQDTLRYFRARADLADWMAQRGLLDDAIQMQSEALVYYRRHQHARQEAATLVRLSDYYQQKGNQPQALQFRRLFRDKNALVKDTLLDIQVLQEEVQRLQKEFRLDDALQLSNRTLALARTVHDNRVRTHALYQNGVLLSANGRYRDATRVLQEAEKLNPPADALMRRDIYHALAAAFAGVEGRRPAYEYALRYAELSDTLLSLERAVADRRLDIQTFKAATLKKNSEIRLLEEEKVANQAIVEQQRLFLAALAVSFLAVILAGFFILRYYQHSLATSKVIARQDQELHRRRLQEMEDKLKIDTMQSMLEGQESERQRVAHDLHDSVGGMLSAARLQLENWVGKNPEGNEDALKIKKLLDETIVETRQIARNLQPGTLLKFGLTKAVQDLIQHLTGKGSPEISFQYFGDFTPLNQQTALHCYRIVQELIQNSLKHARANDIMVQLTCTDHQLNIQVEDDGAGFDPATVQKGMGTGNIQQRVQFLKGEMSLETAPGHGTSTMITIPF